MCNTHNEDNLSSDMVFRSGVLIYLFIYFFLLLFSGTQLRICVQVATPQPRLDILDGRLREVRLYLFRSSVCGCTYLQLQVISSVVVSGRLNALL